MKKYEERIVGQEEKTTLPVDLEPTESTTEQKKKKEKGKKERTRNDQVPIVVKTISG